MTIMLDYEFMRNAFAAAGIVAVTAGMVGYFLVLRGQSFAGHALSHAGFAGATGAALFGLSPLAGLMAATLLAGLGMGALGVDRANRDVAIGMVLAFALGLGMLFLHFFTSYATVATALLFGNVLAVTRGTIRLLATLGAGSLAALAVISRPLLFASLQPELAEAKGVSLRLYAVLFLALVAIATALAAEVVGVLLVFTLLVGPAAAALRWTRHVATGVVLAAVLALAEAWGGLALAYDTDWPASFAITLLSVIVYALAHLPLAALARLPGRRYS